MVKKKKNVSSLHPSNDTYRNVFVIHKNKFCFLKFFFSSSTLSITLPAQFGTLRDTITWLFVIDGVELFSC